MVRAGKSVRFIDQIEVPASFFEVGVERHYQKNEVIVNYGDRPTGFYLVLKGCVGGVEIEPNGNEMHVVILEPDNTFAEANALLDIPHDCQFKALERTSLLFIDTKTACHLFRTDLACAQFIAYENMLKMTTIVRNLDEMRTSSVMRRTGNALLEYANRYGVETDNKIKIDYPISQQYFANIVGVNRITINKSFKQFKRLGLLQKIDDFYYLPNRLRLEKFLTNNSC